MGSSVVLTAPCSGINFFIKNSEICRPGHTSALPASRQGSERKFCLRKNCFRHPAGPAPGPLHLLCPLSHHSSLIST